MVVAESLGDKFVYECLGEVRRVSDSVEVVN
jgi:hypothetical protein